MALDRARFEALNATVQTLQLKLIVNGEPAPVDGLPNRLVYPDLDAGEVIGELVQATVQLTHCVNELAKALRELRQQAL